MPKEDLLHAIKDAEQVIEDRKKTVHPDPEQRQTQALQIIGDELTRLHAEVKTLRYLFATYAARPRV
jgi:hypothetical protein